MMWYAVHVVLPLAFGFRLNTVRPADTRRGAGRHPLHRFGQHRRDQRAAHRQQEVAAAVLLLDALKGYAPVLIAAFFGPTRTRCGALGAVLGHMFTPWLAFKGGRA